MKKILVTILLAFFGVINVNAQELDSLQIKSDTISIESLAARLDKLQHDYDYLYCEYKLNCLQYEIKMFANEVGESSNSIRTYYFNRQYSRALYNSYKDNYYAKVGLFNAFKNSAESLKVNIAIIISTSNFSDNEIERLKDLANLIDICLNTAESSLEHYKVGLDAYRDL